jgi:hypothetical protein
MSKKYTNYNNLQNEGGDGYNPYDANTQVDNEPLWIKLDDQRHRLMRIMEATSTSGLRYAQLVGEVAALEAQIKTLNA